MQALMNSYLFFVKIVHRLGLLCDFPVFRKSTTIRVLIQNSKTVPNMVQDIYPTFGQYYRFKSRSNFNEIEKN